MRLSSRHETLTRSATTRTAIAAIFALLTVGLISAAETAPQMLLLDGAIVGQDIVVVGERGTILRSSDAGGSWQLAPRVTRATLTGASFAPLPDSSFGWAVGHDALILATSDTGKTWSLQFQGENLQQSFLDVLALSRDQVIAVGADGLYVETHDGGKSWTRRKIYPEEAHLNRITRGAASRLYLAGEHGTLLRSEDNGRHWRPMKAPYEGSFYGVLPLGEANLLAYGLRGHVFRSEDNGQTWTATPTPKPALFSSAAKLKGKQLLLAGTAGTLLVSHDDGKTFAALTAPASAIAELLEMPDGRILALGETGATVLPKLP